MRSAGRKVWQGFLERRDALEQLGRGGEEPRRERGNV